MYECTLLMLPLSFGLRLVRLTYIPTRKSASPFSVGAYWRPCTIVPSNKFMHYINHGLKEKFRTTGQEWGMRTLGQVSIRFGVEVRKVSDLCCVQTQANNCPSEGLKVGYYYFFFLWYVRVRTGIRRDVRPRLSEHLFLLCKVLIALDGITYKKRACLSVYIHKNYMHLYSYANALEICPPRSYSLRQTFAQICARHSLGTFLIIFRWNLVVLQYRIN